MVLRLDLGGPALEFVKVGELEYAVELDGRRIPIRSRYDYTDTGYSASNSFKRDWQEAMTVRLYEMAQLEATAPERDGEAFVFVISEERHYRSSMSGTIRMELADGVLVVDAAISESNDSYY